MRILRAILIASALLVVSNLAACGSRTGLEAPPFDAMGIDAMDQFSPDGVASVADRVIPAPVDPPIQLARRGLSLACVLRRSGEVDCWGQNERDQLDFGNPPGTRMQLPPRIRSICSKGGGTACALDPSGAVWCWGSNASGGLGTGAGRPSSLIPLRVAGIPVVDSLHCSVERVCVHGQDNSVWCWGTGSIPSDLPVPRQIEDFAPSSILQVGGVTFTAEYRDRHWFWGVWGDPYDYSTAYTFYTRVREFPLARGAIAFSQSGGTCLKFAENENWVCWANCNQLPVRRVPCGVPPFIDYSWLYAPVPQTSHFAQIGFGASLGCGVEATGALSCWRYSADELVAIPNDLPPLWAGRVNVPPVRVLAIGVKSICVITRDEHRVFCWGRGVFQQDDAFPVPTEIELRP